MTWNESTRGHWYGEQADYTTPSWTVGCDHVELLWLPGSERFANIQFLHSGVPGNCWWDQRWKELCQLDAWQSLGVELGSTSQDVVRFEDPHWRVKYHLWYPQPDTGLLGENDRPMDVCGMGDVIARRPSPRHRWASGDAAPQPSPQDGTPETLQYGEEKS